MRVTLSFEFYPPKTPEGFEHLQSSTFSLNQLNPDYFSVTFGAGGSTREGTTDVVNMLTAKTKTAVVPHISCIGLKRKSILSTLNNYKLLGINHVIALRGDLPAGMSSISEFKYASELIALIRQEFGNYFYIDVAAYPECHPQAKNAESDVFNLKTKYEAGANSAITQYFFNSDAYFYFLDECAKQHIDFPIVPGIMPILHFTKLMHFSESCGAEIPRWLYKRLEAFGDDVLAIRQYGLDVVANLCERLISGGAPGLHFYTLNHAELSLQLLAQLNLSSKKIALVGN